MSVTLALIPVAIAVAGAISTRKKEARDDTPNSFRLETAMKDERILRTALENYGCRHVMTEGSISSALSGSRMLFREDERGVFEGVFVGAIPIEDAQTFVSELHDEYALLVQQQTYERLLSRAKERGLVMESEEVHEDNSIVLTLRVEETQG